VSALLGDATLTIVVDLCSRVIPHLQHDGRRRDGNTPCLEHALAEILTDPKAARLHASCSQWGTANVTPIYGRVFAIVRR
jgi:hypothetical protein